MEDIATLGLAIDSQQVVTGTAALKRFEVQADRTERSILATEKATAMLTRAMSLVMGAFSVQKLIQMTSAWTDLNSRLANAVGSHEAAAAAMKRVQDMARRTYSSLTQTAETFLRNSQALKELGYSTDKTFDFVESLNNALVVSGAKGERANQVMEAFSRAISLGTLNGLNLNTVLANGGRVAQALADSLGVTTNELKRMGAEGKLTTDVIVNGLTSQLEKLRREADDMPATVEDAFQLVGNAIFGLVGRLDVAGEASKKLAQRIVDLADWIDRAATWAVPALVSALDFIVPKMDQIVSVIATMIELKLAFWAAGAASAIIGIGTGASTAAIGVGALNGALGTLLGFLKDIAALPAGVLALAGGAYFLSTTPVGAGEGRLLQELEKRWRAIAELRDQLTSGKPADMSHVYDGIFTSVTSEPPKVPNDPGASNHADPYAKLTLSSRQFIDQQKLEASVLGMTSEQASKLRYKQDLLNQAANDNIKLTPKQREELAGLAEQMAAAEESTRRLTEIYDLGKSTTNSFFSDLKSNLKEGQGLWQAFGNAAANALDRLADKALGMAADGIWDMLFGALKSGLVGGLTGSGAGFSYGANVTSDPWAGLRSGSSGGLLGGAIIPGILHGGGVAGVDGYGPAGGYPASLWSAAPRFHTGLGNDEFAAILQRGERVLTADQSLRNDRVLKRVANNNQPAPANSNQPIHLTVQVVGARGNEEIREMARQGAQEAISAYDRHTLPQRVNQINRDPYAVG